MTPCSSVTLPLPFGYKKWVAAEGIHAPANNPQACRPNLAFHLWCPLVTLSYNLENYPFLPSSTGLITIVLLATFSTFSGGTSTAATIKTRACGLCFVMCSILSSAKGPREHFRLRRDHASCVITSLQCDDTSA